MTPKRLSLEIVEERFPLPLYRLNYLCVSMNLQKFSNSKRIFSLQRHRQNTSDKSVSNRVISGGVSNESRQTIKTLECARLLPVSALKMSLVTGDEVQPEIADHPGNVSMSLHLCEDIMKTFALNHHLHLIFMLIFK